MKWRYIIEDNLEKTEIGFDGDFYYVEMKDDNIVIFYMKKRTMAELDEIILSRGTIV